MTEIQYHDMLVAFREVEDSVVECNADMDLTACADQGELVHLSSDRVTGSATDPDFGVSVSSALKLDRKVEYCQWMEHRHEKCKTCHSGSGKSKRSYRCNCVVTYTYSKGWRSRRHNSLLFNQPAAHYNPQRDPFPAASFTSTNAKIGQAHVLPEIIDNPHAFFRTSQHRLDWTHGAQRPPRWFDPITKFFGYTPGSGQRFEAVENLRGTEHSLAAQRENFYYVGHGGYFFSPHVPDQASLLLQYFGEFLEGSLLNWQIGDMLPSCTAGDIRVSYSAYDPSEASVVGRATPHPRAEGGLALGLFETSRGYKLGVLHEGFKEPYEMFDKEAAEGKKKVAGARALLFPCSLLFVKALAVFLGRGFADWKERALAAVGVEGAFVATVWVLVWRFEMSTVAQDVSMVCLGLASAMLACIAYSRTQESEFGDGGWGDVWNWITEWVNGIKRIPEAEEEEEEEEDKKKKN